MHILSMLRTKTQSGSLLVEVLARIVWFYQVHIHIVGSCRSFGFDTSLNCFWYDRTTNLLCVDKCCQIPFSVQKELSFNLTEWHGTSNSDFVLLHFRFFSRGYCVLHFQALIFLQSNVSYSDSWCACLYRSSVVSSLVPCGRAAVSLHGDGNWSARSQGHVVWTEPWKRAGEWNRCVKCIYATVPVASACNPTWSLFKEANADLRQLDFYVHESWPTGLRVWRFLCDHIQVVTNSRKAPLT